MTGITAKTTIDAPIHKKSRSLAEAVSSSTVCLFLENDRYSHTSPTTTPAIKTETARSEYGAEAINWYGMANQAKIDVSDPDRKGSIGEAEQVRERTIKVSQHLAESEKGKKQAEADQRIYVQKQETLAAIGEAEAGREGGAGILDP